MRRKRLAFERRMYKWATFGKVKIDQRKCMWIKKYKGTVAQYASYLRVKHCEICGDKLTDDNGGSKRCQDHCHNTGRLRAVLCAACNSAQGYLRTRENAVKMVEYFVKWEIMPVASINTETNEKPDAYEGISLFDVSNSPLGPPLTPIDAVVTVGGTTTKRTRSVCVLPHAITPRGASIEDVEVTPDV